MTASELSELTARFPGIHLGVIGDFALDCYWSVDPAAAIPSIETGKPTHPVREQRYSAGAAGNVVANLRALGCGRVSAFGVAGVDPWGAALRLLLESWNIDTAGLVQQADNWATVAYVKPHIDGEEQNRTDFGDFNRLSTATADAMLARLGVALPGLDALVINAQARSNIHTPYLRAALAALIDAHPDKVFIVDSRDPAAIYGGCALKVNDREAVRSGKGADDLAAAPADSEVRAAAKHLFERQARPVFVTRGPRGILAQDGSGVCELPGITANGEIDPTGAGDAALAGIAATLAVGGSTCEAALVGNLAGAVCVRKLRQTGAAGPEELLALLNGIGERP